MWSRVRHRRLQALSLILLAALLTTSLCVGTLYQRSMEQALAGSVLAQADPIQKALRLTTDSLAPGALQSELPAGLKPYVGGPIVTSQVPVDVELPAKGGSRATRLYTATGECQHLEVVDGSCPSEAGQVMVSSEDQRINGWTIGSRVPVDQRVDATFEGDKPPHGKVTIVGVYRADPDDDWLGAPLVNRAGREVQDEGRATDDWVTVAQTLDATAVADWFDVENSATWSLNTTDHDDLVRVGPIVAAYDHAAVQNAGSVRIRVETDLPALAEQVSKGSQQGRTTVVVLVVQLLVLIAVVLWMVLVAATDDRRPEVALARLRGRGRRGAASYLLSELLPLPLVGVVIGVILAPFLMALVAGVVYPVPVPHELPDAFLLAALGSVLAVMAVVLAAASRAVREPVDSLLRAVPSRHLGAGASAAEITLIVFSLTAVVALVTGNLEGPLATLAPTLLAVAVGLLLGRALAPVTRVISRRLLRSGRAVAAAGIVNAVRRPSARRVLVMVVVASALLVFCVDALVTGQHIRQNAAEQANGAHYVLNVQANHLRNLIDAVDDVDPEGRHLTPVVSTPTSGSTTYGPTMAVEPAAFQRIAYFPLSSPDAGDWDAVVAPSRAPLLVTGTTLAGAMDATRVRLKGPSTRFEDVQAQLQVQATPGETQVVPVAVIPRKDGSVPVSAKLPCAKGCVVTGVSVVTPPGLELEGSLVFRDLTVDGQPFSLGDTGDYRRAHNNDGSLVPGADPAGNLGTVVVTSGAEPPVMFNAWVPDPVPALVSGPDPRFFDGPGLEDTVPMEVVGRLPRVPGGPPASRIVDVNGLLRRPGTDITNDVLQVWSDDRATLERVKKVLREQNVVVADETSVDDVRARLDASPAAWSLALSVLVGGEAVLVAMLVMVVATATTWRARATDLAALRMAGLPGRSLRRMELLGQLPVVVVGALAGAACGVVAAVEALPGVRQFTDPPAVDTTDFSTPWAAVIAAAVIALAVLSVLGVVTSRWTARRAPLGRIREVV